jgi:hypothetical protein
MAKKVQVIQKEDEVEVPVEVIAQEIEAIAKAMRKLDASRLQRDASKPLHDEQNREIGMIAYPMSRKSRPSKKQLQTANQ